MPKGPIKGRKKRGKVSEGGKKNGKQKEEREEDNTKESVRNEKEIDIQSTHPGNGPRHSNFPRDQSGRPF